MTDLGFFDRLRIATTAFFYLMREIPASALPGTVFKYTMEIRIND